MASGGVASPTDPIGNLQFSVDEVKAAVEEAESHQTYVMAHAYTAKAIARVVKLGVRTIEHGNLIDDDTARVMAEHGAYAVPTLVTYDAMSKVGAQMGLAKDTLDKNESVRKRGLEALAMLHARGVKIGLGTDLLGDMHQYQSDELAIRADIVGAFEAIRQATALGAEIVEHEGQTRRRRGGCVRGFARRRWRSAEGYSRAHGAGRAHRGRDEEWRVGAGDVALNLHPPRGFPTVRPLQGLPSGHATMPQHYR